LIGVCSKSVLASVSLTFLCEETPKNKLLFTSEEWSTHQKEWESSSHKGKQIHWCLQAVNIGITMSFISYFMSILKKENANI